MWFWWKKGVYYGLNQRFPNLTVHLDRLLKWWFWFTRCGCACRSCISKMPPGEAKVAGLWATFWAARGWKGSEGREELRQGLGLAAGWAAGKRRELWCRKMGSRRRRGQSLPNDFEGGNERGMLGTHRPEDWGKTSHTQLTLSIPSIWSINRNWLSWVCSWGCWKISWCSNPSWNHSGRKGSLKKGPAGRAGFQHRTPLPWLCLTL